MDDKWSGDIFLLGSSSVANHALLDQKLWKICGVYFFIFFPLSKNSSTFTIFLEKISNFLKAQKKIIYIYIILKTTLEALK